MLNSCPPSQKGPFPKVLGGNGFLKCLLYLDLSPQRLVLGVRSRLHIFVMVYNIMKLNSFGPKIMDVHLWHPAGIRPASVIPKNGFLQDKRLLGQSECLKYVKSPRLRKHVANK